MMRKIGFYGLIVLILFIVVFSLITVLKETPKEIIAINYTFSVKDGVGIDLDTNKLNFGGGPVNANLQRKMNISSSFDAKVVIESVGPSQVRSNINNFNINKDQSIEILFNLIVPSNLSLGKYEGTVFVQLYER